MCMYISISGDEPWDIPRAHGHGGEADKGALQKVHGTKVQGNGGKQGT